MRRLVLTLPLASLLLAAAAAPVSAHEHFRVVGNGDCVAMAVAGAESAVVLPDAVWNNPNVDVPTSGPRHPLHLFVHKGVPGDHHTIGVIGTTACPGTFLNTR